MQDYSSDELFFSSKSPFLNDRFIDDNTCGEVNSVV